MALYQISNPVKLYGIVGRKLDHSFSPAYFKRKFAKLRLDDYAYEPFELDEIEHLGSLLKRTALSGFNVTHPYKESVLAYLDEIDPVAKGIAAVNCVVRQQGKWVGYNTDVFGFQQSLEEWLEGTAIQTALVLGSGGGSKAVQYVLDRMRIEQRVVSRTGKLNYEGLSASELRATNLIINTTPLGMHPFQDGFPDIPYEALSRNHWVYDLIYNPAQTAFLRKADILGAKTMNGIPMLELQAEKSWDIWTEKS